MAIFSVFFSKKAPFTIRTEFFLVATMRKFATKIKKRILIGCISRSCGTSFVRRLFAGFVWCGCFERAGDVVQRKKEEDRTENRVEGEERRGREGRGEEIKTTTTTRENTL